MFPSKILVYPLHLYLGILSTLEVNPLTQLHAAGLLGVALGGGALDYAGILVEDSSGGLGLGDCIGGTSVYLYAVAL